MIEIDFYAGLGYTLELLSRSAYHNRFSLRSYLLIEILPALNRRQVHFCVTPQGAPAAMITWAWISEDVERELHATGRSLTHEEWTCGDRLFFNDFIAPYGNLRAIESELANRIFPDHCATSLRRRPDGSVRRINRWTGRNLRRARA